VRMKLFAGIALSDDTRAACARIAERLRACGVGGRFERDEKLHVTLAFLGYVDAERVADITGATCEIAAGAEPFAFSLDKVGAFPNERAPRIVYLGARSAGQGFRVLSRLARSTYQMHGFSFAKDAVAHVTLARVGPKDRAPLPALDIEPIAVRVNELTLFESLADREHHTSRYEARFIASLGVG
jgi:2'-5' RNA ligase